MKRFTTFFEDMQQDLKAFIYWCLVFTLFRIAFIALYGHQLNGNYSEVAQALFLGLRMSLKTAGIVALLGFVFATLPRVFSLTWPARKLRLGVHGTALLFFSICFCTRIPYYKIFNAAFDMMLINGAHDDWKAILVTAVQEYQLLWRLPLAFAMAALLYLGLRFLLHNVGVVSLNRFTHKKAVAVVTLLCIPVLWVFVRYGGAFRYADSINWESAARLKSHLLNEAILDDGQALYRVYQTKKKQDAVADVKITPAELRKKIAATGGNAQADTIEDAYIRHTKGAKLAHQPSNILLIMGESFGNWPLLPKFKDIGLTPRMQALQDSADSAHINVMLAHGSGTISGINGLLTGVYDSGLYANHQAESFRSRYTMGLGYIMQQLGYKTVFWYGGFPGWQNLKNFVLAQSFDEFHCADEIEYNGGNAWGTPDAELFAYIEKYIAAHKGEKIFHVVLTTSNHPPYTLDVDGMGFPRQQIMDRLPADISKEKKTVDELGHIWYADKTMGDFVEHTQKIVPDALFVITGDHSERFDFAKEQEQLVRSAIPCIFYGQGVQKAWFSSNSVGTHAQLGGTLAELLAPKGFAYSAMETNMFDRNWAHNHRLYTDGETVSLISKDKEKQRFAENANGVAAWRIMKGNRVE